MSCLNYFVICSVVHFFFSATGQQHVSNPLDLISRQKCLKTANTGGHDDCTFCARALGESRGDIRCQMTGFQGHSFVMSCCSLSLSILLCLRCQYAHCKHTLFVHSCGQWLQFSINILMCPRPRFENISV